MPAPSSVTMISAAAWHAANLHDDPPALFGELDGIRQQVPHNLLQPRAVSVDVMARRVGLDDNRHALGFRRRLGRLRPRRGRFHSDRQRCAPAAACRRQSAPRRAARRSSAPADAHCRRSSGTARSRIESIDLWRAQHVRPAEDGVERGPQLVRNGGEELILQTVAFLRAGARCALSLEQFLANALEARQLGDGGREQVLLRRQRLLRLPRQRERIGGFLMQPARFAAWRSRSSRRPMKTW